MQFKDIPGHGAIKARLAKSYENNRVHHTQLFIEKPGSAGLSLALAFAQLLNCENPSPTDSCGQCASCQKATKHIHPDIHYTYPTITKKSGQKPVATDFIQEWRAAITENPFIEYLDWMRHIGAENKQGNITAEECRQIIKNFKLKTVEGKFKIQIIWLPETLGKEGNILLKLLEEPPQNTLFLLVTNNEERILNTILSRSQITRIIPISDDEMAAYLQTEFGLDVDNAKRLSLLADGNINRARYLAQHPNSSDVQLKQWFGVITRQQAQLPKFVDQLAGMGRENLKNLLLQGSHLCRESLILQSSQLPSRLAEDDHQIAAWLAKNIHFNAINTMATLFEEAIYHIERNANAKVQLMNLSLNIQDVLAQRVSA